VFMASKRRQRLRQVVSGKLCTRAIRLNTQSLTLTDDTSGGSVQVLHMLVHSLTTPRRLVHRIWGFASVGLSPQETIVSAEEGRGPLRSLLRPRLMVMGHAETAPRLVLLGCDANARFRLLSADRLRHRQRRRLPPRGSNAVSPRLSFELDKSSILHMHDIELYTEHTFPCTVLVSKSGRIQPLLSSDISYTWPM
jgi:hypothetical protein